MEKNIYKPRYKIAFLAQNKIWTYKDSRLRRFFNIRGRKLVRRGLFKRYFVVFNNMKWTVARRYIRPFMRKRKGLKRKYKYAFYTKQQLKEFYGKFKEETFRNFFRSFLVGINKRNNSYYSALERRADMFLFRTRLLPTIYAANQYVFHQGVLLNNRYEKSPHAIVRPGTVLSFTVENWDVFMEHLEYRIYFRLFGAQRLRHRTYLWIKKRLGRILWIRRYRFKRRFLLAKKILILRTKLNKQFKRYLKTKLYSSSLLLLKKKDDALDAVHYAKTLEYFINREKERQSFYLTKFSSKLKKPLKKYVKKNRKQFRKYSNLFYLTLRRKPFKKRLSWFLRRFVRWKKFKKLGKRDILLACNRYALFKKKLISEKRNSGTKNLITTPLEFKTLFEIMQFKTEKIKELENKQKINKKFLVWKFLKRFVKIRKWRKGKINLKLTNAKKKKINVKLKKDLNAKKKKIKVRLKKIREVRKEKINNLRKDLFLMQKYIINAHVQDINMCKNYKKYLKVMSKNMKLKNVNFLFLHLYYLAIALSTESVVGHYLYRYFKPFEQNPVYEGLEKKVEILSKLFKFMKQLKKKSFWRKMKRRRFFSWKMKQTKIFKMFVNLIYLYKNALTLVFQIKQLYIQLDSILFEKLIFLEDLSAGMIRREVIIPTVHKHLARFLYEVGFFNQKKYKYEKFQQSRTLIKLREHCGPRYFALKQLREGLTKLKDLLIKKEQLTIDKFQKFIAPVLRRKLRRVTFRMHFVRNRKTKKIRLQVRRRAAYYMWKLRARKKRRKLSIIRLKRVHWYIPSYIHFDFPTMTAIFLHHPLPKEIHFSFKCTLPKIHAFYKSKGY